VQRHQKEISASELRACTILIASDSDNGNGNKKVNVMFAWSTVPRNMPPQLGAAVPTLKS